MNERPHLRVHATSVVLGAAARPFGGREDVAILLFGASGSGKSDVALRLIAAGARLISDDQTSLFVADGILCAKAAPRIGGLIEIRGAGIVSIPGIEGASGAPVALVVRLDPGAGAGADTGPKFPATIARLPEPATYQPPPPLAPAACPPFIVLYPFEASTPAKIAAIASAAATGRFVAGVAPPNNP